MAGDKRSFWVYFKGDLGDLQSKTRTAKQELRQAQRDIQVSMRAIGRGMTIVGGAIVGTIGYAVKEASDFQTGLREIATLGVEDMDTLERGIRDVARSMGQDLGEATTATYRIISKTGLEGADAIGLLEQASRAAVAGVSDIETAMGLGVGTMEAFGLEVEDIGRIYDEAFVAVQRGDTTFRELGATIGDIAPTFAGLGLSTTELFSAISATTNASIATDQAVTGLNAAISNIRKPTADAAAMAEKLGIEFSATALQAQGFEGFVQSLREAIVETGEDHATAITAMFGSQRGFNVMMALTGQQADALSDTLGAATNATGALDRAYKEFTTDNIQYNLGVLWGQLKDVRLSIADGLLPVLADLTEWVGSAAKSFADWTKENPGLTKGLTLTAGAVGGLMFTLGPLVLAMPGLVATFKALQAIGWAGIALGLKSVGVALAGIFLGFKVGGPLVEWFIDNVPYLGRLVEWWIDRLVGQVYWMWGKLKQFYSWIRGSNDEPMRALSPEERDRAWRESQHGPMLAEDRGASGGARPSGDAASFLSLASRATSQGSGLARQAQAMAPTFAAAGAGGMGGGGLNLNISFGDVRIREQADINRIADAITRRAYDMLAQRGIRR